MGSASLRSKPNQTTNWGKGGDPVPDRLDCRKCSFWPTRRVTPHAHGLSQDLHAFWRTRAINKPRGWIKKCVLRATFKKAAIRLPGFFRSRAKGPSLSRPYPWASSPTCVEKTGILASMLRKAIQDIGSLPLFSHVAILVLYYSRTGLSTPIPIFQWGVAVHFPFHSFGVPGYSDPLRPIRLRRIPT